MMPPKKSAAARIVNKDVSEKKRDASQENDGDEENKPFNIFDQVLVDGKRKRVTTEKEEKCNAWIGSHLEEKENSGYKFLPIYESYLAEAVAASFQAMDEIEFRRLLKQKFSKGVGIKENSKYFPLIQEKKPRSPSKPRVLGDTLKLKWREILQKSFQEDLNNPKSGVTFRKLVDVIAVKYPALQIDHRKGTLVHALENTIRSGCVIRLKGVGKSGIYRWYDAEQFEKEEQEEKEERQKRMREIKEKREKLKAEKKEKDGDESPVKEEGEEEAEGDGGEEGVGKEGEKKKKKKKKSKTEGDGDEEGEEGEKKKKKRKPKKRSERSWRPKKPIVHGQPKTISETFPLACTFGSEPKEASGGKIKAYIAQYYDTDEEKIEAALDKGVELGYFKLVRGNPHRGSYQLTVESFDPTDDEDTIGKIINAIMACHEPKQCTGSTIKQYLLDYHPQFKVAERSYFFKRAVEKALRNGDLVQVSGVGTHGTLQLGSAFTPSPIILAGNDREEDYIEEFISTKDNDDKKFRAHSAFYVEDFLDAYKPRPSKRKGSARTISAVSAFERLTKEPELPLTGPRKVKPKSFKTTTGRKVTKVPPSPYANKKGRGSSSRKATPGKQSGRKRSAVQYSEDSNDEDLESEAEEAPPKRKTPVKGKTTKGRPKAKAKKEPESEDEVERDTSEYTPRPSQSRGGGGRARAEPAAKSKEKTSKRKLYKEDSESGNEDEAPAPKKAKKAKKSKKGKASKSKSKELVSDSEEDAPPAVTKFDSEDESPTKSRGRTGKKSYKEDSESEGEDEAPTSKKSKKGKANKVKSIELVSDSEEDAPPPPITKAQRKAPPKSKKRKR